MDEKDKDSLSPLTLSEALLYLGPGAALLLSLRVWAPFSVERLLGPKLAEYQAITVFVFGIFAYSLGLIIDEWSKVGSMQYMRGRLAPIQGFVRGAPVGALAQLTRLIKRNLIVIFHWMPLPAFDETTIESQLAMNEAIKTFANLRDSAHIQSPWDRLENYRLVARAELEERASGLLRRAEKEHQHLAFLLGLSLVGSLLAFQTALHSIIDAVSGAWAEAGLYLLIAIGAALVTVLLRLVAGRVWEVELLLTCQLATIIPKEKQPQIMEWLGRLYSLIRKCVGA
jgi:hypothetical protein